MCEEIILHRYDDTPWGFRLTGGHDFGIPLTVVRVTGGSLAEEAGMCVGDMIIEINGDPTAQITHSDAQQCILEAGNTVNLSILRGSPVPAVTPTRCLYTPSAMERATSSVGSVTEHESSQNYGEIHNYRDNVISAASSGHEMTEEEIAEKLLESAEVIENNGKNVIGVNFKRFVPKCDFIKNSLVFQTLQEEQIYDEKSEQEQLKKCPTKRFSTFLTTPNRPRIKPPEKRKPEEVKKEPEVVETIVDSTANPTETESCDKVCTNCKCKIVDIEDMVTADKAGEKEEVTKAEEDTSIADQQLNDDENDEDLNEIVNKDVKQDEIEDMDVDTEESAEKPQETSVLNIVENENKETENEFVKSVQNIQNQLNTIRQLPLQIQNHIALLEKQLSDLLSKNINTTNGSEGYAAAEDRTGRQREGSWVKVDEEGQEEEYDDEEVIDETGVDEIDEGVESSEEDKGGEKKETVEEEELQDKDSEQMLDDKEPTGRPVYPLTPLPRPIVLPGGRKWRCPKDAYNEEFIAETLISQAEVLVGSTLGVNFRKYEPPKFDVSNSAVYKLVHNIESKNTGGIENRPEKVAAEEDFYYHKPIDARQFYLATLPQPPIVPDFENESQHGH